MFVSPLQNTLRAPMVPVAKAAAVSSGGVAQHLTTEVNHADAI